MVESTRKITSFLSSFWPKRKVSRKPLRAAGVLDASLDDINDERPISRDLYADEIYSERERKRARASSRKLFCDNPNAFHMAFSEMLSVLGTPPNVQFRTPDECLNHRLEQSFKTWAEQSGFYETLSMMVLSLPYDGEGFARIQGWGTEGMKIVPVEPKRISSPPELYHDPNTLDGIEYDAEEEPIGYWIEKKNINPHVSCPLCWDRFPAFEILHFFVPFFPEQHRGFPLFDSSERSLRAVEDLRQETIESARTNSRIHGIVTSELPFDEENDPVPDPMDTIKMPRKGLLTLGNGQKVTQLKNEALAVDFASFLNTNVTVAGAGSMLPRNIATNDSSSYNFSSARLDHLIFNRWVNYQRPKRTLP
ncbi:MAG: phage portal protein [Planctomycetia bacterium]|nr:phage portal protein [Planctomycetia bacterium]